MGRDSASEAGRPETAGLIVGRWLADPVADTLTLDQRKMAEELLQETFVDVLEHIGAYEGRCPLPAWIRALAVNRALMYLRSPWHRGLEWLDKDPGGPDRLPAAVFESHAPLDAGLERALMTLPALSRAVVWLHDVEGFTHAEIGIALGRTPSFSKSQLARAHRRLRELLAGDAALAEVTP